jgi:hypothetical protein
MYKTEVYKTERIREIANAAIPATANLSFLAILPPVLMNRKFDIAPAHTCEHPKLLLLKTKGSSSDSGISCI